MVSFLLHDGAFYVFFACTLFCIMYILHPKVYEYPNKKTSWKHGTGIASINMYVYFGSKKVFPRGEWGGGGGIWWGLSDFPQSISLLFVKEWRGGGGGEGWSIMQTSVFFFFALLAPLNFLALINETESHDLCVWNQVFCFY